MSKERGILFSGPMVRAILDGRKTQTRRVVQNVPDAAVDITHNNARDVWFWVGEHSHLEGEIINRYGKPGDRLWVRETWGVTAKVSTDCWMYGPYNDIDKDFIGYRADDPEPYWHWKPSIHMPRRFSRITLEITDVRVERLQRISGEDIDAEGVLSCDEWQDYLANYESQQSAETRLETPHEYWARRWDRINGKKHPWNSNPWVWVISFRQV
jgi:hypothetical protein